MRSILFKVFPIIFLFTISNFSFYSCSPKTYCPGTSSTGNSATMKRSGAKKAHCPGTSNTGNFKPQVRKKAWKEDGLTSRKMEKAIQQGK